MTTSLRRCSHSNPGTSHPFSRLRLVPREPDAVAVVVSQPMSPNYSREQMCEAKMDPESPLSDDVVRKTGLGVVGNGTAAQAEEPAHDHHYAHHDAALTPRSELDEEDDMEDDLSSDDMISVGGSPSPSSESNLHISRHPQKADEYFRPLKKLRMVQVESPSSQTAAGLKSFSISDILSHKPMKSSSNSSSNRTNARSLETNHGLSQQRIVRPWDPQQQQQHQQQQQQQHQRLHHSQAKTNGRRASSDSSPLDALFQMTSKTFEGLNGHHESSEMGGGGNAHQMFNSRQPPKKKRKSRTAFTNHQIFELEKRFLYQKYLSPADRDDIAQQLGLTNAQVITWFQNRRAKLKRDMEELKKDMESAKILSAHKSFLESAHDLGLLKKRAQNQMDMNSAAAAASFHMSSPTSSSQSSHSPINLTSESPPSAH